MVIIRNGTTHIVDKRDFFQNVFTCHTQTTIPTIVPIKRIDESEPN